MLCQFAMRSFFLVIVFHIFHADGLHQYPKCCNETEVFAVVNASLKCQEGDSLSYAFVTSSNAGSCDGSDFCLDVLGATGDLMNKSCSGGIGVKLDHQVFPKCCPLKHAYDSRTHSCVPLRETQDILHGSNFSFLVKIGLQECVDDFSAIKDYVVAPSEVSIDLNGTVTVPSSFMGDGRFCVDKFHGRKEFVVRSCDAAKDVCKRKPADTQRSSCIRKCCPDGQVYFGKKCTNNFEDGINVTRFKNFGISNDNFSILHGTKCKKYIAREGISYSLDADGFFTLRELGVNVTYKPTDEMYCVERLHRLNNDSSKSVDLVLLCMKQVGSMEKYYTTRVLLMISCIFIVLTMVAYLWLLDTLNLFAKTLVTYCANLLVLFSILIYLQFDNTLKETACIVVGYILMGLSLSAFTWMNTMCFDIWWTFGTSRGCLSVQQKYKERKRFALYSLYAWGVPLVITTLTVVIQFHIPVPDYMNPHMGLEKCLLTSLPGNWAKLVYFVLPITVFKIADVIFFIMTGIYCMRVKNAINKMNDTNAAKTDKKKWFIADKERLGLLVKLFFVMGISWLFEAISGTVNMRENKVLETIERILDSVNCLQGLLIFIIFVCKRAFLANFKRKAGLEKLRRTSLSSALTQSSTLLNKTGYQVKTTAT